MLNTAQRDAQVATLPDEAEFIRRLAEFDDGDDVTRLIYEPLAETYAGRDMHAMDLMGGFFSTLMSSQQYFNPERYTRLLLEGMRRWIELLVPDNPMFVRVYCEQLAIVD